VLQRAARSGPPPQFVTKRVADPNMIPMLVAAGVEFGAVKVSSLCVRTISCGSCCRPTALCLPARRQGKQGAELKGVRIDVTLWGARK
jgi:hypothetical protein